MTSEVYVEAKISCRGAVHFPGPVAKLDKDGGLTIPPDIGNFKNDDSKITIYFRSRIAVLRHVDEKPGYDRRRSCPHRGRCRPYQRPV
jgi:hypothetical protein